MYFSILDEFSLFNVLLDLFDSCKIVMHAVLLSWTRRTRRVRNGKTKLVVRKSILQHFDKRSLTYTRRATKHNGAKYFTHGRIDSRQCYMKHGRRWIKRQHTRCGGKNEQNPLLNLLCRVQAVLKRQSKKLFVVSCEGHSLHDLIRLLVQSIIIIL